ncbi:MULTISPECIES: ParA family protein [Cyanophyceae]|uniref:ParA family protein n=1 Tax=Cyanophyceae TaxID=3028117 RepID=UPI00016DCDDF|nr:MULTISPECIES: ParA family protein [Cyanophyceae]ACB00846.1 ATPase, ParA family [Picosynechococcus sp. PCC 7002]SMH59259.1 chromosome partitioning protein [Picosynechococcus sp. OG1]SMQ86555.1 chromosome partitioning protein [Synechococcus sp. 7002]
MIISVFNFKGGVGKSTTVANLGAALATQKRKVLVIDLDAQRTLSFSLATEGKQPTVIDWLDGSDQTLETSRHNLQAIAGSFEILNYPMTEGLMAKSLKGLMGYDVILLDCPPAINAISVEAILSCDRLIIPVVSEPAVIKGLAEAVELVREEDPNLPIDVLRSRYRSRLVITKEYDAMLADGAKELGFNLLKTTIPENVAIAEAVSAQISVLDYAKNSIGAKAFKKLAKEILNG